MIAVWLKTYWPMLTILGSIASGSIFVAKLVPTKEEMHIEISEVKSYVDQKHLMVAEDIKEIKDTTKDTSKRIDAIYNHLIKKNSN